MSQNSLTTLMLLDVAAKSLLLLAVTWLGAMLLHKRSAATLHHWWTLGFAGCLAIPAIAVLAPNWTLPILPQSWRTIAVSPVDMHPTTAVPATVRIDSSAPDARRADSAAPVISRKPQQLTTDAQHARGTNGQRAHSPIASRAQLTEDVPAPSEFAWATFVLTAWLIGMSLCVIRKLWQHVSLLRLLMRCTELNGEKWEGEVVEASRALQLRRTVSLLKLDEAQSPLSAGLVRSVVVLPGDADRWSPARRRLVLLHELAHVKRRDVFTQTLAGVVSAMYWFNPLCWYGLLQMRRLRELACDDLVVSCGQQPADYADVLLDVARSYRHRGFSTAVGMAHSANVESRIVAILDKARRHTSLSRTSARLLFASAAALVLFIGTAQLRSQAEPAADEAKQDSEIATTTEKTAQPSAAPPAELADGYVMTTGTMRIRVLDPDGQPFPGVKVTAKRKDYQTNADGFAEIKFPERLSLLRVWVRKKSHVPLFIEWWPEEQADGHLIPTEFTVRLQKGTVIGGVVQNEQGQPIQGATVEVRRDSNDPAERKLRPQFGTWLAYGGAALKTDAEGRWTLDNVPPGENVDIRVKLSHPDYSSDARWGDLQRTQSVTTEKLRTGDATIVMSRGTHIEGTVVDLEGKPVTKGWVVWSDTPYFFDGTWEAAIDSEGRFRTPPLPVGEHPITIVAPGYAAQRRVVRVGSDPNELHFNLRPGKRIEIRFVDAAGNQVPRVGVYLANSSFPNTWNGSNALHNHKHPNVPEYGISRRADDKGVFVWDWAPEETVRYSVGAKGFAGQQVSLVAKSEPHIITLAEARVVAGLVTDLKTGEPIKKFQAMPVIVFRPNFFSTRYADVKQGAGGRYELPLTGSGNPEDRYRVRFEAEGYRSVVSEESFGPQDGRVELNVQLEPTAAREGRVVDAEGRTVSEATVIEGTPTWVPRVRNGEPDSYGERSVRTDSDGRFALNATIEPVRIRATHDLGFAEILRQPNEAIGTVTLQPWASVAGRLLQDGQPVADQTIFFSPVPQGKLGEPRFQESYYRTTDAEGRFEFERLPPIAGSVRASLGPWNESPLTSSLSMPLDLKPGEQRNVILGGDGATLTGQVVATGRGDAELSRQWSLNYLISRDREITLPADVLTLGFDPVDDVQASWFLATGHDDWLATRENYFVKLTPDGQLRVHGVPPGSYDLVLRLYEQPAGCLVETVGEKVVAIEVTESDLASGEKDLGVIEVECRAGPRVGENMQLYTFVDPSGRERSIKQLQGRYVLMHVWASWCAPCLENMPDILQTTENLADRPITFVGLNVDKESERAKGLVQRGGWNWSHKYLGDDSDMARQLAISSVPTYYLIGPDGLLVASSIRWSEIKETLTSAIDAERD